MKRSTGSFFLYKFIMRNKVEYFTTVMWHSVTEGQSLVFLLFKIH